ncbi:DENN domain-containing protein 5A-like isoform X4 [Crassostrea virginica]
MSFQMSTTRFADYFVVCGLDTDTGLEPDQLSGDNLQCPPLDRPFKSKVLQHVPENVPGNPFDKDAVGMLCMPSGLGFNTQKESKRPRFHSFLITKEDGSRVFGSAFTFFEEVRDKKICAAMQTLQHMYRAQPDDDLEEENQSSLQLRHSPKVTKRSSPRQSIKVFDSQTDTLFVTKCLCLITQYPFVTAQREYLRQLYEAIEKPLKSHLPLECYVYNILLEVPLPPPGRSLKFYGVSRPVFTQRPISITTITHGVSELPLFDFSLWDLCRYLEVKDLILLFTSVLLEHQILLYSCDYQKLMTVAECINVLTFPFTWQHVYVPILPASLTHFLDAPVPFIMGLHHGREKRSELSLPSEANMCFVDIDDKTVDVPEDLPPFPHHQELKEELVRAINLYKASLSIDTSKTSSPKKSGSNKEESAITRNESWTNMPEKMELLRQSEAFAKISAIAKKTGVWTSIEEFSDKSEKERELEVKDPSSMGQRQIDHLKFNNMIREIFLNHFLHLFSSYETFVIQPTQDMESWLTNRETMQNFDKAAFLSDQPEAYLPFMSSFTETQMFATLIDNKILSHFDEVDPNLRVFDSRLKILRERLGEHITHTYAPCTTIEDTENMLEKRVVYIDHVSPRPHALENLTDPATVESGFFPRIETSIMNVEISQQSSKRESAMWRRKDRTLQHSEHIQLTSEQREKYLQDARHKHVRQPKLTDMSAAGVMQTNWKFVETLLQEIKNKTKRMLVEKMGHEAIELGHGDANINGVEENTMIASLCEMLERIWSHGLQSKKGKSALWSHLLSYLELQDCHYGNQCLDSNRLAPPDHWNHASNVSVMSLSPEGIQDQPSQIKTHRRKGSTGRIELPTLNPLPSSLAYDMRKVQQMVDIRTDVGHARAWVRLALEKKMLESHLKELLSDADLLRNLYKRYAFLRCEDEREQFLFHLLSLNAVDYFSYTNSFLNTVVPYKVLIYPSPKFGCSTTSANPWISFAGQQGETGVIDIPKGCLEFNVEHKNLGILTTLRIGHDNTGLTPRWLVEYVLVRNELTGHLYKFPCGRWLGKMVDDGSTERLLVAQLLPQHSDTYDLDLAVAASPPNKALSPNSPKKSPDSGSLSIPEIQERLGHAINNLVKHFYKPEKERGNLTYLLCGDQGLVHCLELVFQYGFRSSRLFRNKFFIWDYLEKVKQHFENVLTGEVRQPISDGAKAAYWIYCNFLNKINSATESVGKDGKFQIFVCVGIRDHLLQKLLPFVANSPVTAQMYEENSFLRNYSHINYLVHILGTLEEFQITLESSLLRGLEI